MDARLMTIEIAKTSHLNLDRFLYKSKVEFELSVAGILFH